MQVIVNGETRELSTPITVAEFLCMLELRGDRVAVELNGRILHRDLWAGTRLRHQDRLEIVQFVGGG